MTAKQAHNFLFMVAFLWALVGCSRFKGDSQRILPPVTQEFRYRLPGAGEVFLMWGVNGWKALPEDKRPDGTKVVDSVMQTPMVKDGDVFVVQVQVPAWTTIDYGFLITKRSDGATFDNLYDSSKDFETITSQRDGVTEINANLTVLLDQAAAVTPASGNVPQAFRYSLPQAGEVYLVWGIDGWGVVPEEQRPAGTEVIDNVMRTPMTRDGDTFVTVVRVPSGSTIDYGFLVTRTVEGSEIQPQYEGREDFHISPAEQEEEVTVTSSLALPVAQALKNPAVIPLVTETFRYQMPEAGEVYLIWGINGWSVLPEESRPPGTRVEDKLMKTAMFREGDVFVASVQVPAGSTLDYGFLITKNEAGAPVKVWESSDDVKFHKRVTQNGLSEVISTIQLSMIRQLPSTWVVLLFVVIGFVIIGVLGFIFKRG